MNSHTEIYGTHLVADDQCKPALRLRLFVLLFFCCWFFFSKNEWGQYEKAKIIPITNSFHGSKHMYEEKKLHYLVNTICLYSYVLQMCGELISGDYVIHTARDLPAGLHLYSRITGLWKERENGKIYCI